MKRKSLRTKGSGRIRAALGRNRQRAATVTEPATPARPTRDGPTGRTDRHAAVTDHPRPVTVTTHHDRVPSRAKGRPLPTPDAETHIWLVQWRGDDGRVRTATRPDRRTADTLLGDLIARGSDAAMHSGRVQRWTEVPSRKVTAEALARRDRPT